MNKIHRLICSNAPQLQRYIVCNFNTTSCANSVVKQAKFMNKMMSKSSKRKYYANSDTGFISPTSVAKSKGQPAKSSRKRVNVLNKLFMKYVTDLMTTGDIGQKVFGRQIEISKVNIAPDFNLVNVFWISRGIPDEVETEEVLAQIAGDLRHQLSQLKIIGVVPMLQFVKDKQYAKIMEVELMLAKADFGEDFIPTDQSYLMKSEFTLNSRLDPHLVKQIEELNQTEEVEEALLFPMRHDVFGLDREKMLCEITQSMHKSRVAWKKATEEASSTAPIDVQSYIPQVEPNEVYMSTKDQKQQFFDFLKKREILKKKTSEEMLRLASAPAGMTEEEEQYSHYDHLDNYVEEDFEEDHDRDDLYK